MCTRAHARAAVSRADVVRAMAHVQLKQAAQLAGQQGLDNGVHAVRLDERAVRRAGLHSVKDDIGAALMAQFNVAVLAKDKQRQLAGVEVGRRRAHWAVGARHQARPADVFDISQAPALHHIQHRRYGALRRPHEHESTRQERIAETQRLQYFRRRHAGAGKRAGSVVRGALIGQAEWQMDHHAAICTIGHQRSPPAVAMQQIGLERARVRHHAVGPR